jgi:PTH2 family peptidyl-tRNA hydrolase
MEDPVKQIIVIRKDLGMRRGKEIAQGAHASIAWLTRRIQFVPDKGSGKWAGCFQGLMSKAERAWCEGSFTKICVVVNSEEELRRIVDEASEAGLETNMITDAGKTEFNGVPTVTCCAIGPDYASKIDPICKHLKLY